jgi:uncharacterized protein
MTPLALASTNGNAGILERLLKAGVDVNSTVSGGETALMAAARADRVDAVKVLLTYGANVNARETFRGQTALMWASARNNLQVAKTLLEAGADINAKTPLAKRKHVNDGVDFLATIEGGGQTGWQWAGAEPSAFSPLLFAIRAGHKDMVALLLDSGANVNDTISDGTSALVVAVTNAHFELAAYLLDRGADPNANGQGWTALHQAVRGRRTNMRAFTPPVGSGTMESLDLIKKLLAIGAAVNARMWNSTMSFKDGQRQRFNYMGATPFLVAAKIGDVEVMRLLLASGADPKITNVENENALMVLAGVALFNPGEDAGSNPEHMAERLEGIKLCAETLALDVNALSRDNENALHGAAYLGDPAIVEYLAERGVKLDVKNDRGWTPLMIANGVAYAEFYKEQPPLVPVLTRLMAARGIATDKQIGDQVTCKDCFLTRGEEAHRRVTRDAALQSDTALVTALKNAR